MYTKDKRGYMSGPIEHDSPGHNWRTEPKKILTQEFGINVFDPFADPKQTLTTALLEARDTRDFETITKIAKGFVRKDLSMVDRADIVFAQLPYKVPTCGSHHEIINSNNAKKPTLLVCPQGKQFVPLWYYGFIPHEFMFDAWDCLYEYLREVNAGKHMDNNRWAYVYGLI
jgi:hypothetical protein